MMTETTPLMRSKDKSKKFVLTDEVKGQYEELSKSHHIENPATDECPYF